MSEPNLHSTVRRVVARFMEHAGVEDPEVATEDLTDDIVTSLHAATWWKNFPEMVGEEEFRWVEMKDGATAQAVAVMFGQRPEDTLADIQDRKLVDGQWILQSRIKTEWL